MSTPPTPVILLHDGAIDEFMATVLLTTMPNIDLRAIIVVNGDCIATPAMNAAWRIQQFLGRKDIPLGLSAARGYNPFPWSYRGDCVKQDGLAMLQVFPPLPTPYADGDGLFREALRKSPAPVTVLCTGPMTPIAMLLDQPDRAQLLAKIGRVVWMGGAVTVAGNLDPTTLPAEVANPYAEWNVFWDPFAADRVFRETSFPITLFPLDITNTAAIEASFMATLLLQGKAYTYSNLAYQSYAIVAAESFYDMWDVTATAWLARPDLYVPPTQMCLSVVTAAGGMTGALVPAVDGRLIDVVLAFANRSGFYAYVANQFARPGHKSPPILRGLPDLPVVNWSAIAQSAPTVLPVPYGTPAGALPTADVVVLCWTKAEWGALSHVFCTSGTPMSCSEGEKFNATWTNWTQGMPSYSNSEQAWDEWGSYQLVQIGTQKVLLLKANTHLTWPGETYLAAMAAAILEQAKPKLLMSTGTAGGSRLTDKLGTVNVGNAATFANGGSASAWPTYRNSWSAPWELVSHSGFSSLLLAIPVKSDDLKTLATAYNTDFGTSYSLETLDALGLDVPDAIPAVNDLTALGTPLLTTSTFVVAYSNGNFQDYACVEMDDALLARACQAAGVAFAFVRNVSDPAQNPAVVPDGDWGGWVYSAYGLYTSYNGALVAAAMLMQLGKS